jgi:hypothetical protein
MTMVLIDLSEQNKITIFTQVIAELLAIRLAFSKGSFLQNK